MAISIQDLDQLLGYEPESHTLKGPPSMAPTAANGAPIKGVTSQPSKPVQAPKAPASIPSMDSLQAATGLQTEPPPPNSQGIPSMPMISNTAPQLQKPKESTWQKIGHGLRNVAEVAGDVLAPGVTAMIPGTKLNNEFEQARQARLAGQNAETGFKNEQTEATKKSEEEVPWTPLGETSPINVPFKSIGQLEGSKQRAEASEADTATRTQAEKDKDAADIASREKLAGEKAPSEGEAAIKDYMAARGLADTPANRDKARDAIKTRDKVPRAPTDREEWQKDHPNEPIENYWKAKAGAGGDAKAAAGEEAGKAAQQYADDYLKNKKFTGAGDEALMEKYFELAKPSSGFRMTQPQIEMLTKARDMMNSIVAQGKHLFTPEAPYFSETQRQQIVDTMKNLESARQEAKSKPSASSSSGTPSVSNWLKNRKQ